MKNEFLKLMTSGSAKSRYINSTRELSQAKHLTNIGIKEFGPYKMVNQLHNVDSEVPGLNLLVNDRKGPIIIQ